MTICAGAPIWEGEAEGSSCPPQGLHCGIVPPPPGFQVLIFHILRILIEYALQYDVRLYRIKKITLMLFAKLFHNNTHSMNIYILNNEYSFFYLENLLEFSNGMKDGKRCSRS